MWAVFNNFRARASSILTKAFLVPLKGFFVGDTFTPDDGSSLRQLQTASSISSTSTVGSMSKFSNSTVGTRWRTNPVVPIASLKAESNLTLSLTLHCSSTRRSFVLVSLILPIFAPRLSRFTLLFRFFRTAVSLTPSEGFFMIVSDQAGLDRTGVFPSSLFFLFFRMSILTGTSTHSSACF